PGISSNNSGISGMRIGSLNGLSGDNPSGRREGGGSGGVVSLSGSNNSNPPLKGESGDRGGREGSGTTASVSYGSYYLCSNCGKNTIHDQSYKITRENVQGISSSHVAITVRRGTAEVEGKNVTVHSEISEKPFARGVSVSEGGKVTLNNLILKNAQVALYASDGMINVDGGTISDSRMAVQVRGQKTHVILKNVEIKTTVGHASLSSESGAEIKVSGASMNFIDSHAVFSALDGKVALDSVNITGKGSKGKDHAVFLMSVGGTVNFKDGIVNVNDIHGILSENTFTTVEFIPLYNDLPERKRMTEVNLTSSSVTVEGEGSYGIYFKGDKLGEKFENREKIEEVKKLPRLEAINLRQTMFSAPESVALYSTDNSYGVVNLMQSTLSGRSLLRAERGALVKILASASTLEGGAHVDDRSTAELYLGAGSTWTLKQNQERDSRESAGTNDSSISFLLLMNDSSIKFHKLKTDKDYNYQTLHIGKGTGIVYKAQDGAHIYLNTYLNEGGELNKQKTDRVLIHGDVSGKTTVYVRSIPGSPGGYTGIGGNNQGISLIQVSGKAEKDSFQLDGGYVTVGHSPYQYTLYAYGPESDLGKAHPNQKLVKGEEAFWDFRLENRYIKPSP
ncbi:autotransporter outer membrane beta-barrel domain-containing protein, partial [Bartonella henselae]|nr:autotransporter outer membrane beta-barrel domain-containing protein [Bartonella henselae]MDM9985626.1 autotransporter outer membrane beta-barrel domain-containing protein [Bartonella henselae]MDM9987119.1 autotransporter outer membrane beta-barrel domain-containing protein [Bartonella henselae]MDM9988586.1 autotransporter outer membrane beta-barrel domain-containing protein [Bartonella henselae]MDM9990060.1 autotransporter outer membrane beta-barrel domain-containing protein [Bartonella hen